MHARCGANGSEHVPRIAFPLHCRQLQSKRFRSLSCPQTDSITPHLHAPGARSCPKDHGSRSVGREGDAHHVTAALPLALDSHRAGAGELSNPNHFQRPPARSCAPGYAGRIVASAVLVVAEGGVVAARQAPQLRTPRARHWAEPMPPPSWGSAIAHLRRAGARCALRLNVAVQAVRHPHNPGGSSSTA